MMLKNISNFFNDKALDIIKKYKFYFFILNDF